MHRAAVGYAERLGWAIFPIKPGTKVPHARFVRHGFLEATADPEQIRRWWSADPTAGVAVACARSGLVVIDADLYKPDCGFFRLERELGPLPETPRQLTPQGGCHFFFRDTVGAYLGTACTAVDIKHGGYVLLAPTVHPNRMASRWDTGAHVLETPIAELPVRWLEHVMTVTAGKTVGVALPSSGIDARESYLGKAFEAMNWLGDARPGGRRSVRCPWVHEHTDGRGDGRDSSCVIFPRSQGATLGGFRCSHGHCAGRTWRDVLEVLPAKARWAADRAMQQERNRIAFQRICAMRSAS
jgi:hypothetical protein